MARLGGAGSWGLVSCAKADTANKSKVKTEIGLRICQRHPSQPIRGVNCMLYYGFFRGKPYLWQNFRRGMGLPAGLCVSSWRMKKSIFISGASKGIGLAVARKFYQEGFTVGISARGEQALAAAKAEMPQLFTYCCDMADKAQVQALAQSIAADMGSLEVLVNNAGIYEPGLMHEEPAAQFERMMNTNVYSAYYLTQGVIEGMKTNRQGSIFNIGSIASFMPYGGTYAVTKHAMLGFSRVLREEMKPFNIRVVTVMPGAVLTDSWSGTTHPEARFMPAEDIAQSIWDIYQLSDRTVVEEITLRPIQGDI